ncbi:hypothetical protein KI387_007378, partial [Taxus chinensis]
VPVLVHHTTVDHVVHVCTAGETSFVGSQDFFSIDEMLGNVFGTGATDIGLSQ